MKPGPDLDHFLNLMTGARVDAVRRQRSADKKATQTAAVAKQKAKRRRPREITNDNGS